MKALSRVKNAPKPGDHVTDEEVKKAIEKVKKEKQYQWHEKSICSYYCEVKTGKIVAQYHRLSFSDEVYHAEVNGDRLGQYISEKCARKAIEDFITKHDEQYAEMKAKSPYLFSETK
jgi:hypothetical protein